MPWFYGIAEDVVDPWAPASTTPSQPGRGPHTVCLSGPGVANVRGMGLFRSQGTQGPAAAALYGSDRFRYVVPAEGSTCDEAVPGDGSGRYTEVMVLHFQMAYRRSQGGWQSAVDEAEARASTAGTPFFAISTGDELCEQVGSDEAWAGGPQHPLLLYRAYWSAPMRRARYAQYMPLGVRSGFRIPSRDAIRKTRKRPNVFTFVGSETSPERLMLRAVVNTYRLQETYPDSVFRLAAKWSPDDPIMEPREYQRTLGQSVFTLCPAGHSPEAFRIYEAAAAGSIPVVALGDGYREHMCQAAYEPFVQAGAPFVFLETWADLPRLLAKAKTSPGWTADLQARVRPWFDTFMGDFFTHFERTVDGARKAAASGAPRAGWTDPRPLDYAVSSRLKPGAVPLFAGTFPRRKAHPSPGRIPLVTGCGRSGSGTVAAFLPTVSIPAVHEGSAEGAVSVGWPYAALHHEGLYPFEGGKKFAHRQAVTKQAPDGNPWGPVVHLVRHPLEVIGSVRSCFCGGGVLSTNQSVTANRKSWDHLCRYIDVPCGDALPDDNLRKSALYWLHWNRLVRTNYPGSAVVRLESPHAPAQLLDALGHAVVAVHAGKAAGWYALRSADTGALVDLPEAFPELGHISRDSSGYRQREDLSWDDLRLNLGHDLTNEIILDAAAYGYTGLPSPALGTPLGRQMRQQQRPHRAPVPASAAEPVVVGGLGDAGGLWVTRALEALGVRMNARGGGRSLAGDSSEWAMPLRLCNMDGLGTLEGVCSRHQARCCVSGWPHGGAWFDNRLTPAHTHGRSAFRAPDQQAGRAALQSSRCTDEAEVTGPEGCSRDGLVGLAGRLLDRLRAEAASDEAEALPTTTTTTSVAAWGWKHPDTMAALPLLAEATGGAMKFILVLEDGRSQVARGGTFRGQVAAFCEAFFRRATAMDERQREARLEGCRRATAEDDAEGIASGLKGTTARGGHRDNLQTLLRFWSAYNQDALATATALLGGSRVLLLRLEDLTSPMPNDETLLRLSRFLGIHRAGSPQEQDVARKARLVLEARAADLGEADRASASRVAGGGEALDKLAAGAVGDSLARFGYGRRAGERIYASQELDTVAW